MAAGPNDNRELKEDGIPKMKISHLQRQQRTGAAASSMTNDFFMTSGSPGSNEVAPTRQAIATEVGRNYRHQLIDFARDLDVTAFKMHFRTATTQEPLTSRLHADRRWGRLVEPDVAYLRLTGVFKISYYVRDSLGNLDTVSGFAGLNDAAATLAGVMSNVVPKMFGFLNETGPYSWPIDENYVDEIQPSFSNMKQHY